MKKLHFYGSCNKEFIYPLPTVVFVNYANMLEIQLSWLVFNFNITLMKKGRY